MPIKLTPAQAKALGLETKTKIRRTRKAVTGEPYHSRCVACGDEFRSIAAEDRHVDDTKHARYEVVT
jgi:hypothetical protein